MPSGSTSLAVPICAKPWHVWVSISIKTSLIILHSFCVARLKDQQQLRVDTMKRLLLAGLLGLGLMGCGNQSIGLATEVQMSELEAVEMNATEVPSLVPPTEMPPDITAMPQATATETPGNEFVDPMAEPVSLPLPGVELFTFKDGEPGWYTVDDNVMGGVSSSAVTVIEPGNLLFSGTMSLDNNGGFSSARSDWLPMDLSSADGILLRVLGDGKTYRLRIRTAEAGPEISYNAYFETKAESWQVVYVPFSAMVPTFRGFVMDVGALNPATIGSFGLMLSDKQPGEFSLTVDWLRAVSQAELQAFSQQ
jgi:monofunctional biosynthetic peptidoglycan transglycosylase